MSSSDDEMHGFGLNDDQGDVRGQQAQSQQALAGDEDELMAFISQQKPDPDGNTFQKFQQAAEWSDLAADAHAIKAAKVATRDAARVIADQARVKGIVDAMVDVGLVEDFREYYHYNQQSPGVQAVIDRYIINPGISNAPFETPYVEMTHSRVQTQQKQQGKEGGYKSKLKSKKSRYNKKSKTNKRRRSRSNKRSNKRSRK
jgi:hypothetical protein